MYYWSVNTRKLCYLHEKRNVSTYNHISSPCSIQIVLTYTCGNEYLYINLLQLTFLPAHILFWNWKYVTFSSQNLTVIRIYTFRLGNTSTYTCIFIAVPPGGQNAQHFFYIKAELTRFCNIPWKSFQNY